MAAHADADDAELCDAALGAQGGFFAQFREFGLQGGFRLGEVCTAEGEGDVRDAVKADVLHDHVDGDVRGGDGTENGGADAGAVGHIVDGDLGLIAFEADAAHDDGLHAGGFFFHEGSGVVVHAVAHFKAHTKFVRELD